MTGEPSAAYVRNPRRAVSTPRLESVDIPDPGAPLLCHDRRMPRTTRRSSDREPGPARPADSSDLPEALRAAIAASGLSLRAVHRALTESGHRVSLAALSSWQSGSRRPDRPESREALRELERILDMPAGALLEAMGPDRLHGRPPMMRPLSEQMPQVERAHGALAALEFSDEDLPHELSVIERVTFDVRAGTAVMDGRILARALRPGPCRMPSVHVLDDDEPNIAPVIEPSAGCRIGRRIDWPDQRTYGAELILDDDVEVGDLTVCEYRVHFAFDADRWRAFTYSTARRSHEILLLVQFDDAKVPSHCEMYTRTEDGQETVTDAPVNVSGRARAQALGFGPGLIGLRWTWDGPTRAGGVPGPDHQQAPRIASAASPD